MLLRRLKLKFKGWVKAEVMEEIEVEGDSYSDALAKTREGLKDFRGNLKSMSLNVTGSEYGVRPNENK